jgi:hypothetical protein
MTSSTRYSKINIYYLELGIPVASSIIRRVNKLYIIYSISSATDKILGYAISNQHPSERDRLVLHCSTHMNAVTTPIGRVCSTSFTPWFPGKARVFDRPPMSFRGRLWREIRPGDKTILDKLTDIPLKYLRIIMHNGFLPAPAVEKYLDKKILEHNEIVDAKTSPKIGITP